MKRIIITLFVIVCCNLQTFSQNKFNLPVAVILADDSVPAEAGNALTTKLKSILTKNGYMASDGVQRFVLTAKISIGTKDVLPTNPPRISQKMDVSFFIGDVIDNRIYESCTVAAKGIGINENKAFISSFQSISPQNKELAEMLTTAKESISEYYRNNYKAVLKKADALTRNKEYDAAIYELVSIPEIDTTITAECQNAVIDVYQQKIDDEARPLLREAKSIWMAEKNHDAGKKASELLARISPMSSVVGEADALLGEIDKKLRADEAAVAARKKEEMEYQRKKEEAETAYQRKKEEEQIEYQRKREEDDIAYNRQKEQRDFDFTREKHRDEQAYRNSLLAASREVSLAYAKNQPKTITKNIIRSW